MKKTLSLLCLISFLLIFSEVVEGKEKKNKKKNRKSPNPEALVKGEAEYEKQKPSAKTEYKVDDQGWTILFNGKDLKGWNNPYTHGEAKAVNGEVHLIADKKFFLVTEKKYSDFVFEAEIKMPEGKANSGFMFRCHVMKNKVWGYQAEVDPSDRAWSGGLYDEGRRKWLNPKKEDQVLIDDFIKKSKGSFKRNDWNKYRIECKGENIKIYVNDTLTTDYKDSMDKKGYIGIQHHGENGQLYRFRNIRILISTY